MKCWDSISSMSSFLLIRPNVNRLATVVFQVTRAAAIRVCALLCHYRRCQPHYDAGNWDQEQFSHAASTAAEDIRGSEQKQWDGETNRSKERGHAQVPSKRYEQERSEHK